MAKLKIHPLGPVTVAVLAVLSFFVVKELGLGGKLATNMGLGQGIGYGYGGQFARQDDENSGTFVLPNFGNALHEKHAPQPHVTQDGHSTPIYNFYNQMFRSEDTAFLER